MPFLSKNPLIPNKPEPFKKPESTAKSQSSAKVFSREKSWSEMNQYDIDRHFKNPKVRHEIKVKLGLPLNDEKKLDEEINDMKKMMNKSNKFNTGVVSKDEAKRALFYEEYWRARRAEKTPMDYKGRREEKITKKEADFLKNKFGLGKK